MFSLMSLPWDKSKKEVSAYEELFWKLLDPYSYYTSMESADPTILKFFTDISKKKEADLISLSFTAR